MLKSTLTLLSLAAALVLDGHHAPKGPFNPEAWPPSIDRAKEVHFVSVDGALQPPSGNWIPNLKILTGGDHAREPAPGGGHGAVRVAMFNSNPADDRWPLWAKEHNVDILMQVFGDEAILD